MSKPIRAKAYPSLSQSGFLIPADMSSQSYEGATTGRRLSSWGTSSAGPNAVTTSSLNTLRSRSHETIRNNPYGCSAKAHYVSNMVGTGFKPRWRLDDEQLKKEIQQLWEDWVDEADAYGQTDFYGLLALIVGTEYESGECLVRFRDRQMSDGLSVPLQLQVLEPDHLDTHNTKILNNGNTIQMGIELNAIGERAAYWLSRRHPGDNTPMSNPSLVGDVRVPAEDIIHCYRMLRPGQLRGLPHLATVLVTLKEIDETEDGTVVRAKAAGMFAAFITRNTGDGSDLTGTAGVGTDEGSDTNGNQITGLEPGMLAYLDDKEEITFSDPPDVGGNLTVLLKHLLRKSAIAAGVTYEQMTGDLSEVNFSSIRAGLIEFRRRVEMLQYSMVVHQVCRRVANRWLLSAVVSGAISIPDYFQNQRMYRRIDWQPPGWQWVKPLEDVMAAVMKIRAGLSSREAEVATMGNNVEDIDVANARDRDRAKQSNLVYDTDASQTNKSGAIQDANVLGVIANDK